MDTLHLEQRSKRSNRRRNSARTRHPLSPSPPPGSSRILFHRPVPRHCFLPHPTAYSLQSNQAQQEGANEDAEESDTRRYTPPRAEGQEDSMYDVEQSPDEIAQTLLAYVPGGSEEDETSSTDSLDGDGDAEGGRSLTHGGSAKPVQTDEWSLRSGKTL